MESERRVRLILIFIATACDLHIFLGLRHPYETNEAYAIWKREKILDIITGGDERPNNFFD